MSETELFNSENLMSHFGKRSLIMNLICGLINLVLNHVQEVIKAVVDGFRYY